MSSLTYSVWFHSTTFILTVTLLYMSLSSVLRKVAAGTYIGGYLFYIYLGWLPNGTVTIARSFLLIRVISGMERPIAEMM